MALYVGLMSGTSLDGIDGVLTENGASGRLLAHAHLPFEAALRTELLALNAPGEQELHRAALAANALARAYAELTSRLLREAAVPAGAVRAVGAHGQTVRHRPGEFDGTGYTLQLLNGALLAELSGIDVICDLRSRDVAAGGQGAPLVPGFHAARFAQPGRDIAVLNLGGIANLTLLAAGGEVLGFDTGPANLLMDHWCETHTGAPFDRGGAWAGQGKVDEALLRAVLAEPYFHRAPPKSTGRDLFTPTWLHARLALHARPVAAQDVQATLLALTATTACAALHAHLPGAQSLYVCGGGAFNAGLMSRLTALAAPASVLSTQTLGVAPDHVEALAFAWLAQAFVEGSTGSLPAVTGARGARVLGALYPA